jgi:hypothetical protein
MVLCRESETFKNDATEPSFGRENNMRGRQIALSIALIMSVVLLCYSLYIGVMIGADWYGKDATFQWHMNNYIVMDGQYAYSIFGLATMVIGGLATGLAMSSFLNFTKTKKHILILVPAFFVAIAMSGLGFNTLDFMLGSFYWTNMTYPPPVQVALIGPVDVWNFYFFFFVVPLWFSGFLMGSATAYFTFIYKPLRTAEAYIAKKNLGAMIHQSSPQKEYVAESKVFWRNRSVIREAFDTTN